MGKKNVQEDVFKLTENAIQAIEGSLPARPKLSELEDINDRLLLVGMKKTAEILNDTEDPSLALKATDTIIRTASYLQKRKMDDFSLESKQLELGDDELQINVD